MSSQHSRWGTPSARSADASTAPRAQGKLRTPASTSHGPTGLRSSSSAGATVGASPACSTL
eukprot:3913312-Prymnesium_polylepis.2